MAVQHCNATILMGRTIRVDLASTSSTSGAAKAKSVEGVGADPKRTVFVGNLDFASKEEDLRAYFEGVIKGERGMPGGGEDEAEDDEEVEEDEDEDKQEADEEEGDAEYSDKEDEREEDFVEAKDVSSTKTAQPEERKAQSWVTSVRIVRDRDTQLGKGFAYVQFAVCFSRHHPFRGNNHSSSCVGPRMCRRDPRISSRGRQAQIRETQAPRATLQDHTRR